MHGQRCPRIRFGRVHIANCLWENGTDEDPAQYCIGIGHSSKMYIENGDFSRTVIKSGQTNMRGHNKYFLQSDRKYHFTMTGCIGEDDAIETGQGYSGDVYNPYADADYHCRVYPASMVYGVLTNPDNGAGATLDEDLLTTRGNAGYATESAIETATANDGPQVVGISYYNTNGVRLAAPRRGLNIMVLRMSDGTTRRFVTRR